MPEEIETIETTEEQHPTGVANAVSRWEKLMADNPDFQENPGDTTSGQAPDKKPQDKPADKIAEKKPDAPEPRDNPTPDQKDKPAEAKPVLDDAPPGNVVGKAADSWNSFKAKANKEIAARESKIAELQREVEAAKKNAQPIKVEESPEFVSLKKKYEELDSHFKVSAVERHPDFVKYFGEKTKAAVETAKSVVGAELAPKLEKILKIGDAELRSSQLEELASELSPFKQGELANAVSRLREIDAEKAAEIDKAAKSYEALQAKNKSEQEQSAEQRKADAQKLKNDALSFARQSMESFKTKEGDDAHNESVKQNEALVEAFFDGTLDRKLFPTIPALAAEAIHFRQTKIPQLESELKKRDEIIAKYQSANPKLEDGGNENKTEEAPVGGKFLAEMKKLWPGK